jgi:acyl carrier protein
MMTKTEIIQQLKLIVKPYVKNQTAFENLTEETDFIRDLEINSANLVDIILDVEEAFDLVIDNQEMETMLTISATVSLIENKLAQKE